MTRRRAKFAVIAAAVVAIAIAAAVVWVRSDESSSGAEGPFLTAADLPSGYEVSRLANTAPTGIGGATTPAECGPVIAEQASREFRSTTVGVLAVPEDTVLPTFAESVVTGGESVADTAEVVRRCSSYRQQTDSETLESISSILPTPAACPRDALVIRVRTRAGSPTGQSDSTAVRAHIQGRAAVGVLTASLVQPESALPDDFCRLASLVADRLE